MKRKSKVEALRTWLATEQKVQSDYQEMTDANRALESKVKELEDHIELLKKQSKKEKKNVGVEGSEAIPLGNPSDQSARE